ncbi:Protein Transport Protein Sec31B [Manis pentadactyla]|nr:Protein Transport Protein Sec31B [Manis pentadactyla]
MQVFFCPQIFSSFSKGQPFPPLQVPEQVVQASLIHLLRKPPKWMRRPANVSFAFGGKLVTFGLSSTPAHQVPQPHLHLVFIGQGTTESALLMWSAELQEALGSGNLPSYWQSRIQQASLQSEKMLWQFLKVTLEQDYRLKFLKLLGYNKDEFQKKVTVWLKNDLGPSESPQPQKDDLSSNRLQASCSQASKYTTEETSASSTFYDELIPQNMTPWEIPITEGPDGVDWDSSLLTRFQLHLQGQEFSHFSQSVVTPSAPSHPSLYQGSRMQNINGYRAPGSQPLPQGPGVSLALSQLQLLRGQTVQAANPVGFPGTWPLPGPLPPMATRDILQPGSASLAETAQLLPLLPVRSSGLSPLSAPPPAPQVSFPAAQPLGGPGAPRSGISPVAGLLAPHPGPQDSLKKAPTPRANLWRKKQLRQQPTEKMERKELPPEHQSLETSFEAFLQLCSLSATYIKTNGSWMR